jgi:hypothetical protein
MCMVEIGEALKFSEEKEVKARKNHVCCECMGPIPKGTVHRSVHALNENRDWVTYRTCAECEQACDWLSHECGGYLFTCVMEDIEEHISDGEERPDEVHQHLVNMLHGMKTRHTEAFKAYAALKRIEADGLSGMSSSYLTVTASVT